MDLVALWIGRVVMIAGSILLLTVLSAFAANRLIRELRAWDVVIDVVKERSRRKRAKEAAK